MKKAKIMLMAIAVMGVVGGALAFKAHKAFNGPLICSTTTTGCVLPEKYTTTTTTKPYTILYCTTSTAGPDCTEKFTVTENQ